MTKTEAGKLVGVLVGYWTHPQVSLETSEVWVKGILDLDAKRTTVILATMTRALRERPANPVAEIRERYAREVAERGVYLTADRAYSLMLRALRSSDPWKRATEKRYPLVAVAVQRLGGWTEVGKTPVDDMTTLRAQFRRVFEQATAATVEAAAAKRGCITTVPRVELTGPADTTPVNYPARIESKVVARLPLAEPRTAVATIAKKFERNVGGPLTESDLNAEREAMGEVVSAEITDRDEIQRREERREKLRQQARQIGAA